MKKANFAPLYAIWYPTLSEIARKNGYALAIHGSLARDMDLILVGWTNNVKSVRTVIHKFCEILNCKSLPPIKKPLGRERYRLFFDTKEYDGAYLDVSCILQG